MVELVEAVEGELAFVDEDVDFILKELLAVLLHLFGHGGAEHHHLLLVGGFDEDVLDVSPHAGAAQHLIALVDHKVFALSKEGGVRCRSGLICASLVH